jgi:2-polyprenyl-6-methoxyphenol hydroxylase-like FAD-dependent oxidoreductase
MRSAIPPGAGVHTGRAVVLGASMAGLLAARALSETFEEVIVVDRDNLTGTGHRKGVPQGQHAHGILAKGREILEDFFPGMTADLTADGALGVDLPNDVAFYRGTAQLSPTPSDLLALCVSRPGLEDYVRHRVRQLPNVDVRGGYEAIGLLTNDGLTGVTGVILVRLRGSNALAPVTPGRDAMAELTADLVVDATGRGNRSAAWLGELGYPTPGEDIVKAGIAYATREYERKPLASGFVGILTSPTPECPYGAALLPLEGDRWVLTLIGMGDDIPPTDVDGFNAFAHRLSIADLRDVVDNAVPLTEPKRFRVPASVRRRYERLALRPEGYLTVGDALCAFNPVYGQGMTVAAIEATVLRECVLESRQDLPARFYREVAKVIDIPWDMAVGGDLAFPSVEGERTMKHRVLNVYLAKLLAAAQNDPTVALAFHQTINLTNRPEGLFAPRILKRVLFPRPKSAAGSHTGTVARLAS